MNHDIVVIWVFLEQNLCDLVSLQPKTTDRSVDELSLSQCEKLMLKVSECERYYNMLMDRRTSSQAHGEERVCLGELFTEFMLTDDVSRTVPCSLNTGLLLQDLHHIIWHTLSRTQVQNSLHTLLRSSTVWRDTIVKPCWNCTSEPVKAV